MIMLMWKGKLMMELGNQYEDDTKNEFYNKYTFNFNYIFGIVQYAFINCAKNPFF